jgi:hypothetical protein
MSAMEQMLSSVLKSVIGEEAARMLTPENLSRMGKEMAEMLTYFKNRVDAIDAKQDLILAKLGQSGIAGLEYTFAERIALDDRIIHDIPNREYQAAKENLNDDNNHNRNAADNGSGYNIVIN